MSADHLLNPDELSGEELHAQLMHDVGLLEKAAKKLRWQGWLWLFWFSISALMLFFILGIGNLRLFGLFFVIGVVLLGLALFYLVLARYVARGHRWAIALGLFLVSIFASIVLYRIFTPRPLGISQAVFDTFFLVATLNLLKSLFQSWGAARRIRRLMLADLAMREIER